MPLPMPMVVVDVSSDELVASTAEEVIRTIGMLDHLLQESVRKRNFWMRLLLKSVVKILP